MSIFAHKDLYFNETDTSRYCKEKDLEICAVELESTASKLLI